MRKAFRAHSVSTSDTSWNIAPGFFHSVPRRSRTQPESSITTARNARARIESPKYCVPRTAGPRPRDVLRLEPPFVESLENTRERLGRACRAIGRFARCSASPHAKNRQFTGPPRWHDARISSGRRRTGDGNREPDRVRGGLRCSALARDRGAPAPSRPELQGGRGPGACAPRPQGRAGARPRRQLLARSRTPLALPGGPL